MAAISAASAARAVRVTGGGCFTGPSAGISPDCIKASRFAARAAEQTALPSRILVQPRTAMRHKLFLPAVAAVLFFLAACNIEDFSGERYSRDFHYSFSLKPNGRLTVESFNGSVEVSGWDQNTVDISGVKYGPSQEAADTLKIDIADSPEEISVRAVRPSDHRGSLGARFTIKIPRGARLDRIVTSNGAIRTIDGAGPARLRTSNGSIHVQDLAGSLDAQTSNSSVELLNVAGDATVRSSNGHIRADGLTGSLDANTSNSGINAKIGEAAKSVRLDTSNGSV